MACVLHARDRAIFADRMRSVGKRLRDESGKYPVNENDEEIVRCVSTGTRDCERSEAIPFTAQRMDCFASLAMTYAS